MLICPNCKAPNPARMNECYSCRASLAPANAVPVGGGCIYCGEKVGWLKDRHPECQRRAEAAWQEMVRTATQAALSGSGTSGLETAIRGLATSACVPNDWVQRALLAGWEAGVEHSLEDGLLSEQEESALLQYANQLKLSRAELDANGWVTKATRARVLREIAEGRMPPSGSIPIPAGVNLQASETVAWAFPGTQYYEEKTTRTYVGGTAGVSFRVAKGVYLRTGAFRGHPVEKAEMRLVDEGTLILTNRHLYFAGAGKSLRIPYPKIVNVVPHEDGVGICRDAASAKPQTFVTGDGWFAYNMLSSLMKLA